MEQLLNILGISLSSAVLIAITGFILHWYFIYWIIKTAVKNAILEAKTQLDNPTSFKTPEQDFEEEYNGWN